MLILVHMEFYITIIMELLMLENFLKKILNYSILETLGVQMEDGQDLFQTIPKNGINIEILGMN